MKFHIIQHVPYEGPGIISHWINQHNFSISYSHLYENQWLPEPSQFDALIVMGGPMSINDEAEYNWLPREKELIRNSIAQGKIVLGICLGAQMIAAAAGAKVYPHQHEEIGWFPISLTPEGESSGLLNASTVFHWHGDTFDLPQGAIKLAYSEATPNQAFLLNDLVVGLQFHIEITPESLNKMYSHGLSNTLKATYIQDSKTIISENRYFEQNNRVLTKMLDQLAHKYQNTCVRSFK